MKKYLLVSCVVIAAAILYWFYRQGQLGAILPWVLIAACPLMHLFMMRNMHHDDNNGTKKDDKKHSCH